MGLFRRRSSGAEGDDEPDPTFPFLTVGEAARLRALTRQTFARHGVELDVHADHLSSADGQYGLHNLFALCRTARREREWPAIVEGHVTRMLRAQQGPEVSELSADEVLAHAFVRVAGLSTLPDLGAFGYRRALGGDLVELLAYDTPDTVVLLGDEVVDRVGADALRAAGVDHLLREPFGDVEWLGSGGARFAVVVGESVYTASRLLTMDDVLRRVAGDAAAPYGTLVSVPVRDQLAFHVLRDASVVPTVEAMARFTAVGFADGVGGVSPHLFYRSADGVLEQLTRAEDDGTVAIVVEGAFAEALEAVVGRDPDGRPDA